MFCSPKFLALLKDNNSSVLAGGALNASSYNATLSNATSSSAASPSSAGPQLAFSDLLINLVYPLIAGACAVLSTWLPLPTTKQWVRLSLLDMRVDCKTLASEVSMLFEDAHVLFGASHLDFHVAKFVMGRRLELIRAHIGRFRKSLGHGKFEPCTYLCCYDRGKLQQFLSYVDDSVTLLTHLYKVLQKRPSEPSERVFHGELKEHFHLLGASIQDLVHTAADHVSGVGRCCCKASRPRSAHAAEKVSEALHAFIARYTEVRHELIYAQNAPVPKKDSISQSRRMNFIIFNMLRATQSLLDLSKVLPAPDPGADGSGGAGASAKAGAANPRSKPNENLPVENELFVSLPLPAIQDAKAGDGVGGNSQRLRGDSGNVHDLYLPAVDADGQHTHDHTGGSNRALASRRRVCGRCLGGAFRCHNGGSANCFRIDLDGRRALQSSKNMLALVSVFALSVHFFGYDSTATLTVSFVMGGHVGTSFSTSLQRVLGTVAGSVVPYLMLVSIVDSKYTVVAMMGVWVALSTWVRFESKGQAYAGFVSAFTTPTIIIGGLLKVRTVNEMRLFALARTEQTFVGIAACILFELFILPQRETVAVKRGTVHILGDIAKTFDSVINPFIDTPCKDCRVQKAASATTSIKAIQAKVARKKAALAACSMEPQMWRAAFPLGEFSELIDAEESIARNLMTSTCRGSVVVMAVVAC